MQFYNLMINLLNGKDGDPSRAQQKSSWTDGKISQILRDEGKNYWRQPVFFGVKTRWFFSGTLW